MAHVEERVDTLEDVLRQFIIPVFASLYLAEDVVKYLTRNNIYAMAMKEDTMDILNFGLVKE